VLERVGKVKPEPDEEYRNGSGKRAFPWDPDCRTYDGPGPLAYADVRWNALGCARVGHKSGHKVT